LAEIFVMTICDTFKRLSLDTWDRIRISRQVTFQLKEETFTDLNMLTLKARHGRQIKTKVFTKRQEGKNGADWEWWFKGLTGKWIGLRIQAKIINIDTEEFEHLHYQTPSTKMYQCDKLIKNALTKKHPRIPLYCLFIQTDNSTHLTSWPCGSYPSLKDLFGCSLTSAFTVKKLRTPKKQHLKDVQKDIRPWHCLVCCSNFGNGDWISKIQGYAKENFDLDSTLASELEVTIPDDFSTESPPDYVLAIYEGTTNDNVSAPDEEIDGVVIYEELR
jgi:hypothetical protein